MSRALSDRRNAALNKLAKWRTVFASWQLGTRSDTDPECKAVKDHREATILLRAEVTALTGLMLRKGLATQEELQEAILEEATALDQAYERRFPGFSTSESGVHMKMPEAAETMRRFPK